MANRKGLPGQAPGPSRGQGPEARPTELEQEVSELKEANRRLLAKIAQLKRAEKAREAEHKRTEEKRDEFLNLVSHELRTPLTIIIGSLRTALCEGVPPEDARELLQNASNGADSLANMLENLLELSRWQAHRLQLGIEPVDIADVARRAIRKMEGQRTKQRFVMDVPQGLPSVQADPVRVERILCNLLENAVKYSPEDSEIKVLAQKGKGCIVMGVADHGAGISPDDQAALFEPFQGIGKPTGLRGGVGLGLVVCQKLAEAHGGKLWVKSELGCGSTFFCELPWLGKEK